MAELNQAWTAASEELYKAQQAGATADAGAQQPHDNGGAQSSQQGSENVTDAEFEEVK
jgi:molecular chaperone DnaK